MGIVIDGKMSKFASAAAALTSKSRARKNEAEKIKKQILEELDAIQANTIKLTKLALDQFEEFWDYCEFNEHSNRYIDKDDIKWAWVRSFIAGANTSRE